MDNLALDYEKKERLENAQAKQAYLSRFANAKADNYPKKTDPREMSVSRHRDSLRLVSRRQLAGNSQGNTKEDGQDESADELENNPELARKRRLEKAVTSSLNARKDQMKNIAGLAEAATPMGALSLASQINFIGDMPFVAAIGAAIFKDLLDGPFNIVLIGALFSILCSIFIFMMLFLVDANKERKSAAGLLKKGLILIAGGVVDAIPGIGILPIETLTVGIIYVMTLIERKKSQGES